MRVGLNIFLQVYIQYHHIPLRVKNKIVYFIFNISQENIEDG